MPVRSRNYKDKKYVAWRKKVYTRDNYTCVMCGTKTTLEAHHIKKWSDSVNLRYTVSSGCTLCKKCHVHVTGHEEDFEYMLMEKVKIIEEKNRGDIKHKKEKFRNPRLRL